MQRVVCLLLALTAAGCRPSEPAVSGTATYAGGPTLPADAVLDASLIELPGRPDVPPRLIGSVLAGGPGPSPIAYRIPYDPGQIDSARRYAVRARLLADRSVLYLTEADAPVLTHGHGRVAAIRLVPATITRRLPATFTGTLPCDDCASLRYQIDLLPDSLFYLRAIRRRTADSTVRDDIGRWSLEAGGSRLVLRGGETRTFAPFGASVLRQRDSAGRPVGSGREHDLLRTSAVAPLEPALPLNGLYREVAGEGLFADCRTARPMPVAAGGDRAALEAGYRRARVRPEGAVLVRFQGRIVRDSAGASLVSVTRFLGASRTDRC